MISSLNAILSKELIGSLKVFFLLFSISALLETLSIAALIPFFQVLGGHSEFIFVNKFLNYFNIFPQKKNDLLYLLLLIIFIFFTIKSIFISYFSFYQCNFILNLRSFLNQKLYRIYLYSPYDFYLNNNSSKIIRNISEVDIVVKYIKNLVILINEILVFLAIFFLLIFLEPTGSIMIIFGIGCISFFFLKKYKKKIEFWGKIRLKYLAEKLKRIQETLILIKEIKIYQKFKTYENSFIASDKLVNFSDFKQSFLDSMPKIWLEWLLFLSIIVLCSLLLFLHKETAYIITTLGLLAVSSYRLLPSVIRISNVLQSIQYHKSTFNLICRELQRKYIYTENKKYNKINFSKKLIIKNLDYGYSLNGKKIINNINLKINFGEIIGIIGESGAGKTTLINLILGLIKPANGKILVDNQNIFENLESWHNCIGYISQDVYLLDDTIKNNIAFGMSNKDIDNLLLNRSVDQSKLSSLIGGSKNGINTKIGELGKRISGGQKQRIGIARAFYNDPKFLIFDEATSSLDNETERKIISEIRLLKKKKTVIIVSHKLSSLKYCDKIYKLSKLGLKKFKII